MIGCRSVSIDDKSKEFIRVLIENFNTESVCFLTGPVSATPRGPHVRTRLGASPRAFLVPDVPLWEPLAYFPELTLFCPSCAEQNVQEILHRIRWKDGNTSYDQPRLLYGLRNAVLLVSRVYLCKNRHRIISHDHGILSQVKRDFPSPFVLFHKSGVTREMFQFFASHISAGMTITDAQVQWQQSLFNEFGIRKMCFLNENHGGSGRFPTFSAKGRRVGEKVAAACYMQGYFEKEQLYNRRMCQMTALSLSADHTFKETSNIGL